MTEKAMRLALEALEEINKLSVGENAIFLPAEIDGAMEALRQALEQQPAAWIGLTDEEMKRTCYEACSYDPYTIARAIEAKLKEKNT